MNPAVRLATAAILFGVLGTLECTKSRDDAKTGDTDTITVPSDNSPSFDESAGIDADNDRDTTCQPVCEGRVCGPDGCGGSCGECGFSRAECVDGQCVCEPSCSVGECGQDGCGGYCTPCNTGNPDSVMTCDQRWTLCDENTRSCVPMERICASCLDGYNLCARQDFTCSASAAVGSLVDCKDGWCKIPGGLSFVMGGPTPGEGLMELGGDGAGYDDWYPRHPVVLTRSYEIMQHEVTHQDWLDIMGTATVPTRYPSCGTDCPVSQATFFDALAYANRLSEKSGLRQCYELENCNAPSEGWKLECERAIFAGPDCEGYRLPSEAEFELAAGAGVTSCYPNGCALWGSSNCDPVEDIAKMAWFCGNSEVSYEGCKDCSTIGYTELKGASCCGPHPVGQKGGNVFGLYDMMGNVAEFTGTIMASHPDALVVDPGFETLINERVVSKGGKFSSMSTGICVGHRNGIRLDFEGVAAGGPGFRLVRSVGVDLSQQ